MPTLESDLNSAMPVPSRAKRPKVAPRMRGVLTAVLVCTFAPPPRQS